MCADYARYDAPAKVQQAESPLTAEMREQLRQPGKVILPGDGTVRIEQPQSSPVVTEAEKSADWLNSMTDASGRTVDYFDRGTLKDSDIYVMIGNDRMAMDAAKKAGFIKRGPSGELINTMAPTSQQSQQKDEQPTKSQQERALVVEDAVPLLGADEVLSNIAPAIGDQMVYSLLADAAMGVEISDSRCETLAQVLGGHHDPATVRDLWSAMATAYSKQGAEALDSVGLDEEAQTRFFEWARQNHKGKLVDAVQDMVRRSTRSSTGLKQLGREYIKQTGGGYADAQLESMPLPQGARWHRGSKGELLITIDGWGTTTAKGAIQSGVLKLA